MDLSIENSCLPFLHTIERLKNTPRSGWVKRGIESPESVSDHMWRMGIICMLLPKVVAMTAWFDFNAQVTHWRAQNDNFDQNKCVRMALVHDIGEAIIGDITPSDGISKEEKYTRESLAVDYLSCLLKKANPDAAAEIKSLFEEFEEGETPEAKFVREIDTFECLLQAVDYEHRAPEQHRLHEFHYLESRITSPHLSRWTTLLAQERNAIPSKRSQDIVVIFMIGGPGVGKGTQCSRLAADLEFEHISVGDLLREEANRPSSSYAEFINTSIRESVVIPAQLTCDLVKLTMKSAMERGIQRFLVDGFPRSLEQAVMFEEKIHEQNFSILLDCPEEIMLDRLLERGKASGRADDNVESIAKRLRSFRNGNQAVETHLRRKGPFKAIQCVGSPDDVYAVVKPTVQAILNDVERLSRK